MTVEFSTKTNASINNLVARIKATAEIDLERFHEFADNFYSDKYDIEGQYSEPTEQVKIDTGDYTILVFRSGTFRVMGASKIAHLNHAEDLIKEICDKIQIECSDLEVTNIVADDQINIGRDLKIQKIAQDIVDREISLDGEIIYEPESFSALQFRPNSDGNKHVTIYPSGKMIIAGCEGTDELHDTSESVKEEIYDLLNS